jgi:hypothetical protein
VSVNYLLNGRCNRSGYVVRFPVVWIAVGMFVMGLAYPARHYGRYYGRYYGGYHGGYGTSLNSHYSDGGYYSYEGAVIPPGYGTWGAPLRGTVCSPIDQYTIWGRYTYTRPDMPGYACIDLP